MELVRLKVSPIETNCYLIFGERNFIIDPGGSKKSIMEEFSRRKASPDYIILTHGHWDHKECAQPLRADTGAKLVMSRDDIALLNDRNNSFSAMFRGGGNPNTKKPFVVIPDIMIETDGFSGLAELGLEFIKTPGHSRGSICIYMKISGEPVIFSGDTLFNMSVGRTDFSYGDHEALMNSIKKKLLRYPDRTKVYPGHGPGTTIGYEKKHNPFLREARGR